MVEEEENGENESGQDGSKHSPCGDIAEVDEPRTCNGCVANTSGDLRERIGRESECECECVCVCVCVCV